MNQRPPGYEVPSRAFTACYSFLKIVIFQWFFAIPLLQLLIFFGARLYLRAPNVRQKGGPCGPPSLRLLRSVAVPCFPVSGIRLSRLSAPPGQRIVRLIHRTRSGLPLGLPPCRLGQRRCFQSTCRTQWMRSSRYQFLPFHLDIIHNFEYNIKISICREVKKWKII